MENLEKGNRCRGINFRRIADKIASKNMIHRDPRKRRASDRKSERGSATALNTNRSNLQNSKSCHHSSRSDVG